MTSTTAPGRRRRRLSGYAVVLLALAAIGAVYAALAPRGSADTGALTDAVSRGRQLFLLGCSSCHGLNAEGGNRAPSLIGAGAAAVDFQVGTGRMPLQNHGAQAERNRPKYNQADIDALAAYVASLAPGPAIPSNLDLSKGDLAYGGELFRTNCAQCHNVVGSGGALSNGKTAPSLSDATPKQIIEAMLTGPENMPVFSDGVISPQDKVSIARYVEHIRAQANPGGAGLGRVGPVTEGLVAWVIGIVGCVALTLWIGTRYAN